jgi:spore coat polysaccharide biosynthesis predicted glycosyltransferase SpsG
MEMGEVGGRKDFASIFERQIYRTMTEDKILIVTEANEKVASGHLFESIVCYEEFLKQNMKAELMINADMPVKLKERLPQQYLEYASNIQQEVDFLCDYIEKQHTTILLFNLRKIENDIIRYIKERSNVWILCIDEFGHRRLDADVIVNPMIDEYYWEYPDSTATIFCGAEYLVLPRTLAGFQGKKKEIHERIHTITVSMGGVDAPGTTLKIAKWLGEWRQDLQINLVLGGGFPHKDSLLKIINGKEQFSLYENISFLYDLFYDSDLAVCAGGNTLHELSAIGTPAIVIPSMPHEVRNGKAFEKKGFSVCCKDAESIKKPDFMEAVFSLENIEERNIMSRNGKEITDGRGAEKIFDIVMKRGKTNDK